MKKNKNNDPVIIIEVYTNDVVKIQCSYIAEHEKSTGPAYNSSRRSDIQC